MKVDKQKLWIQILSVIGFVLTIKLAMIYYVANFQKYALPSFCTINDIIDCDGVARTTMAQFWGIPLAYWGMFFYLTVLFLTVVDKLKKLKILSFLNVFKEPKAYIFVLATIAFFISMILAALSAFRINKVCILCVFTYFIDLIIALLASGGLKNTVKHFKTTVFDFLDGAKKYTKTFITLVLLATVFLTYTGTCYPFTPHVKKIREMQKYRKMKVNPYRVKGNLLGSKNANVIIVLYSDYVCPLCYVHNIMLHRAAKEYSNIKIIHHNYPFDKECNPYIGITMHPNACFMARGAIAAKKQGNYWGMSSLLYENQPTKIEDMIKLADKLGFDKEQFIKDFESEEIAKKLESEIKNAESKNVDATPTMFVNGKRQVGVMPYKELQELLEKNGAKRR